MKRLLTVLLLLTPGAIGAQSALLLQGHVMARGQPVAGVNIFDKETLEGTVTGTDGRFAIPVSDTMRRSVHLVARRMGFSPLDTTLMLVGLARPDSLVIQLNALATLIPISVQAGRYTATAERKTTLTPLEVANIPGANADISGAVKTLPGVQNVDEGSGLFVRGGDFTETHMFIDGAPLFSAYQFEAPTGSVAGSINPFLTASIAFLSGGFGVEWGNALSGVVDLRTQGRAPRSYTNVNASILGLSVSGALALRKGLGITATVGATNLDAMLRLNGNPRGFAPAPHGRSASALAAWEYSRTGHVKVFGLLQQNGLGIPVSDPAYVSVFASDRSSDVVVASWNDSLGNWRPFVSASTSGLRRTESKGAYEQRASLRSTQVKVTSPFVFTPRITFVAGAEVERLSADYQSRLPLHRYDGGTNAPTFVSQFAAAALRTALFASFDTRPSAATELIAGIRSSSSAFATARTAEPRVSFAYVPRSAVTLTASWGLYHQVADPAFLDRLGGSTRLPALRSNMAIAGVQLGEALTQLRLETWTKSYTNLVGLTRSYATVAGLAGRARGADLFVRGVGPREVTVRVTYSLSASHRADPDTRQDALAPFDVTHSVTAIASKQWRSGWSAGVAHKVATGHPFTDVTGGTPDAGTGVYVPLYAAPYGERLPVFTRTDVSFSKQRPFGANRFGVVFAGINNVFNRRNTFSYTWSPDYTTRIPVRSTVNRTLFIGANLVLLDKQ